MREAGRHATEQRNSVSGVSGTHRIFNTLLETKTKNTSGCVFVRLIKPDPYGGRINKDGRGK